MFSWWYAQVFVYATSTGVCLEIPSGAESFPRDGGTHRAAVRAPGNKMLGRQQKGSLAKVAS